MNIFYLKSKTENTIKYLFFAVCRTVLPFLIFTSIILNCYPAQQELTALKSAVAMFNDGFYEQANNALGEFIAKHPDSKNVPEAILLQAQSRFKLKDFTGAIDVLQKYFGKCQNFCDEYLFWIAESYYSLTNYSNAIQYYQKLLTEHPASKRIPEAYYRLAICHFHLNQFQEVVKILSNTNSVFRTLPKTTSNIEQIARANLLLADAQIHLGEYTNVEHTLQTIPLESLNLEMQWRWYYLKCRALVGPQRYTEAIALSTNLISLAEKTKQPQYISQSALLVASINEKLGEKKNTIEILNKYITSFDNEQRRFALLKIVELSATIDNLNEAATRLEVYAQTFTNEPAMDAVLLTAGELRLKEYWLSTQKWRTNDTIISTPAESNLVKQAFSHFNKIIADFPNSQFLPKAQLQRGWCLWLTGNIAASRDAFQFAAEKLPHSPEQAIAIFKLGDTEFFLNNYSNAIRSYKLLITNYINDPIIKRSLLNQALYQMLRTSIYLNDINSAEESVSLLLKYYPDDDFSQKGLLLMGQTLNRIDKPEKARALLEEFIKKFPSSPLMSKVVLAIAKSFIKEGNFSTAAKYYDDWFNKYVTNSPQPEAEFDRAFAHYQANQETNALLIFTQFIEKYPTNNLAALARLWIGHFHYRHRDFTNAEAQFQLIFQNTNFQNTVISYQARIMAGRTAFARQGFKDAADYFRSLINDEKCPEDIVIEALFALGDTLIEEGSSNPTQKTQQFNEAIVVFSKIPQIYPTNHLVPVAYGRIADCYLQLASENPENYKKAQEFYQKVVSSNAGISARSQAEVALGIISEKLAALKLSQEKEQKKALEHYLTVIYGKNIRPELNETPDPFWIKKASLYAIDILEATEQWEQLISLCERTQSLIPSMYDTLAKRIANAREKLASLQSKR